MSGCVEPLKFKPRYVIQIGLGEAENTPALAQAKYDPQI